MGNFTLDSIGHIAFGSDLGCIRREIKRVEGKEPSASHQFAVAFDVAQHRALERFISPFRNIFPTFLRPYLFKGEYEVRESRRMMEVCLLFFFCVHSFLTVLKPSICLFPNQWKTTYTHTRNTPLQIFCNKMIDEALTCRDQNKTKWNNRQDLLAMHIKDKDVKHTKLDLVDMILSFFIAGRDTTRATLTFFFKVLVRNNADDTLNTIAHIHNITRQSKRKKKSRCCCSHFHTTVFEPFLTSTHRRRILISRRN